MKTMISMDKKHIKRVTDEKAAELFHEGWQYTTKSVWKEKVRDVNKKEEKPTTGKKTSNKLSKSQKRHMRKANK